MGAKWLIANLNDYFSATECPIDLKPSCIFKFVLCLEVYGKKLINMDHGGTLEGLLSARVPQNQPCRVNFRVHLGVHEGPWGFPEPWWGTTMTINVFHNVQRVYRMIFFRKGKHSLVESRISQGPFKGPIIFRGFTEWFFLEKVNTAL